MPGAQRVEPGLLELEGRIARSARDGLANLAAGSNGASTRLGLPGTVWTVAADLATRVIKGSANPRGYAFGLAERLSRDLLPATRCAESSPALVAENSAARATFLEREPGSSTRRAHFIEIVVSY
jgi:hypothetical protein